MVNVYERSPITGKNVFDYLIDALDTSGKTDLEIADELGIAPRSIRCWRQRRTGTMVDRLEQIEQVSGLSLDAYIPEVRRAIELLGTVQHLKLRAHMKALWGYGITMVPQRVEEIKHGIVRSKNLSVNFCIRFCGAYDALVAKNSPLLQPIGAEEEREEPEEPDPFAGKDEAAIAYEYYKQLACTNSKKKFGLNQLAPNLWGYETERFYRS